MCPRAAPGARGPGRARCGGPCRSPEEVPALKLGTDVRPTHYALRLTVDPTKDGFSGTEEIEATLEKARSTIWINGRDLDVSEAWVEAGGKRQTATYRQVTPAGVARLELPAPVGPGKVTLHFTWTTRFDTHAVGLYKTTEANLAYVVTQFEATDARRAFPSFDQPEFKTPFDLTLTVPAADAVIANTLETATRDAGNGMKEVTFQTTRPLPSYLVALAVGPFDVVQGPTLPPNEFRSYPVPTRGVAPKGRGSELAWALESGAQIVAAEEQYFRIAYPYPKLDQLALPDFAAGAMENAGAITYREQLLLFRPGVSSPRDKFDIASVEAHEIAHQWFGDLVTMPFWTDTWLNEAFATWMANRTLQTWNPHLGPNRAELLREIHHAMAGDALPSARAIRQPLTQIEDVWNQFDNLTYQKGASLLGMFERWGGEEKFRAGITRYLDAHAWGSGSTDDFLTAISEATGRDVVAPFHSFLDQAGIPTVAVKPVCDASGARLELSQKRFAPLGVKMPEGQLWQIPICVRYQTGATARRDVSARDPGQPERGARELSGLGVPQRGRGRLLPLVAGPLVAREAPGQAAPGAHPGGEARPGRNLSVQVKSGAVSYADALEAMAPLARELDPGLAEPIIGLISFARDPLVPEEQYGAVDTYGRSLFKPVWSKLGWSGSASEPTATSMLRRDVLAFLTLKVNDPGLSAQALAKGKTYLGRGKAFDPRAVSPELSDIVLSVAVRDGGPEVFDTLIARLPTLADARLREQILAALAFTRDPQRFERALKLSTDPALHSNERLVPVFVASTLPWARERTWAFIQQEFDQIAGGVPPQYAAFTPGLFGDFCDEAHAEAARGVLPAATGQARGRRPPARARARSRSGAAPR